MADKTRVALGVHPWSDCRRATAALALEVRLPTRTTAKATVVVDEEAGVLFGGTPRKVEVTNLPTFQSIRLASIVPEDCTPTTAFADTAGASVPVTPLLRVPAGMHLLLTDVSPTLSTANPAVALQESSGIRFGFRTDVGPIHLGTPVRFGPGEAIALAPYGGAFSGVVTFIGCLVPAS